MKTKCSPGSSLVFHHYQELPDMNFEKRLINLMVLDVHVCCLHWLSSSEVYGNSRNVCKSKQITPVVRNREILGRVKLSTLRRTTKGYLLPKAIPSVT